MERGEMARAWGAFDGLPVDALAEWDAAAPHLTGFDFELDVIIGDARETLANWDGQADAWFLDGFSPGKNPELWGADLMAQVGAHTTKGGTVATYTAAGFVRRALGDAGFEIERVAGFGRKRHMTRGTT
jgi:tRNA U34 5-methylaminomethyl-2-thiouridine-forming methyltransferase MnmC